MLATKQPWSQKATRRRYEPHVLPPDEASVCMRQRPMVISAAWSREPHGLPAWGRSRPPATLP